MIAELEIHSTKRISRHTVAKGLAAAVLSMSGIGCASFGSSPSLSSMPTAPPLGTTLFTYRGHSMSVYTAAWSPDGKRIASASLDGTVQVWDAADRGNVFTYHGHTENVFSVAWSPRGKRVASAGQDSTAQVWDATDGSHVYIYRGHSSCVNRIAWSRDGTHIASGGEDKIVQIWQAA